MVVLPLMLVGCEWFGRSEEGPFKGPLDVTKVFKVRERKPPLILPGFDSSPLRPEPIVTRKNCEDLQDGGTVHGPDCVTQDIQCGDTIVGHTVGGVRRFDSKFYEKKFCTPFTTNHDGGEERVYRLTMPEGEWKAFVYLDTPCADLDLFAMYFTGDTCPTISHSVPRCEASVFPGTADELVELVVQSRSETQWFIAVEGKGDEEGPFGLHVVCRPGLQ
ncbi:MAG: hypothetical protein H6738_17080 [Alphaproteobacteria bacterium]|nr:hypothetical protein [Alphaproteobacteria bacterium]MCB9698498.1 hypothetical protein [Alphaproteobacteria bacterium]